MEREPAVCTDCPAQGVHPAGYVVATSETFHARDVERCGWDLALCQGCHGHDFAGKDNAPSCLGCHENTPTACTTCHDNPPTTAAHTAHLAKGFGVKRAGIVNAWDDKNFVAAVKKTGRRTTLQDTLALYPMHGRKYQRVDRPRASERHGRGIRRAAVTGFPLA